MTRWLITSTLLALGTVGAFLYIVRPEVIEGNIRDIRAPLDRMISEQKAKKLEVAKENAWRDWAGENPLPLDCINPQTALKTLECKNKLSMITQSFETVWHRRIVSGWVPD